MMNPRTKTLALFGLATGVLALCLAAAPTTGTGKPGVGTGDGAKRPVQILLPEANRPKVQVAILLDTSGSMEGLIAQAKSQLWRMVNELAQSKRNGLTPVLEIALYEYGKSSLPAAEGYMRMILPLTTDLDRVSEELFALTTNGGDEFCGQAIRAATLGLGWSEKKDDLKLIFIAGNEPFSQGGVDARQAIKDALARGITVNPIYCGSEQAGIGEGWRDAALAADGRFMSIDHNQVAVHVRAPQDEEIARLGAEINTTYVPYGSLGASGYARQQAQDANAEKAAPGSFMQRAVSKSSSMYSNGTWDLVDAVKDGRVKAEELEEQALPPAMKGLDKAGRKAFVEAKVAARGKIQRRIAELNAEREKFVQAELVKQGKAQKDTLDAALISAVHEQASKVGLKFD